MHDTIPKKRILITGADGFVGSHLVDALADEYDILAFILPEKAGFFRTICADTLANKKYKITTLTGCFKSLAHWRQQFSQVNFVIHCAGNMLGAQKKRYYEANVASTEMLAAELIRLKSPCQRFVYLSSQAAVGPTPTKFMVDESFTPQPVSLYGQSKLLAEKVLLKYANELSITILRPCSLYGPRDRCFLKTFQMANQGTFGTLCDREKFFNLLYIEDFVQAIKLSLADQGSANIYFVTSEQEYNWDNFVEVFEELLHRKIKRLDLGLFLSRIYLGLYDLQELITGKPSIFSSNKAREMSAKYWLCSGDKFFRQFRFKNEIDLKAGFLKTFQWYEKHGWL